MTTHIQTRSYLSASSTPHPHEVVTKAQDPNPIPFLAHKALLLLLIAVEIELLMI
jgi:hypothetical protein